MGMGWFLNGTTGISLYVNFRPRVGMGWFRFKPRRIYILCPDFRPRLGMGWFLPIMATLTGILYFRPRVGMGWFAKNEEIYSCLYRQYIFVPAWGWVGSLKTSNQRCSIFVPEWGWVGSPHNRNDKHSSNRCFRPRVGMGWFQGLPSLWCEVDTDFRPRLGMGWFLNGTTGISLYVNFRPRVGMGWFRFKPRRIYILCPDFRPRLGMGWFLPIMATLTGILYFRPRVGMGWFS